MNRHHHTAMAPIKAHYFLVLGLLLANLPQALAQPQFSRYKPSPKVSVRDAYETAETLAAQKQLDAAYPFYHAVAQKRARDKWVALQTGICAMAARDYTIAEESLERAVKIGVKVYPQSRYYYGFALKNLGKYEEAIKQFEEYLKENPADTGKTMYLSATNQLEHCARAKQTQPGAVQVANAGDAVNTGADENMPFWVGKLGQLLFTGRDFTGMGLRHFRSGASESNALPGALGNTANFACSPHVCADGRTAYFTRLDSVPNHGWQYRIYSGVLQADGSIVEHKLLEGGVNEPGTSSLFPSIGVMEKGQEILYFCSNREGGEGGFDIWYAVLQLNGKFSRPANIRRINTEANEISPFYDQATKTIFIGCDHQKGLGGYDVYAAQGEKTAWTLPRPLGSPINSSFDDYHYTVTPGGTYFASNRSGTGAKFEQYVNCCDDVYIVK